MLRAYEPGAAAPNEAERQPSSLPGFISPRGSSARLMANSAAIRPGGASRRFGALHRPSSSAEIDTPAVTRSWTKGDAAGSTGHRRTDVK